MGTSANRRIWPMIAAALVIVVALGLGVIHLFISREVTAMGDLATDLFGEDRVLALVQLVDCQACPMAFRNRAVWTLGEIEDARALPVLRRHLTGAKCDHSLGLCQYELDKAIRKTEGTWSVVQRILPKRDSTSRDQG